MPSPPPSPKTVRFGIFEADLVAGELRKRGRKVELHHQPFHVLALLLGRPKEVVTREELRQALWPADTFVEFDESLNKAVQKLRQALGTRPITPLHRNLAAEGLSLHRAGNGTRSTGAAGSSSP
ncbi:MAG: winged helix-turn-helix domain-containing protein [Bryobacteraceae bacterium]